MSFQSLLPRLLGLSKTVIKRVDFDAGGGGLVVSVQPTKREASRCPVCGRKAPGYDAGRGRRRWRGLDFGSTIVMLEAEAPRIKCARHGVLVAATPWARPGSWFTHAFETQVAWLMVHACRTVVAELMRIDWKTVGGIVKRVQTGLSVGAPDPFAGLVNIGIDETSYKKGYKYLTVVVDHDTARIVWVGQGVGKTVLDKFFNQLGPTQTAAIRCVTADGANWIKACVAEHCPQATLTLDPFHIVSWASDALDEVRRQMVRDIRLANPPRPSRGRSRLPGGVAPAGAGLKNARYALLKNPADWTANQQTRIDMIAADHPVLHRAWRLKERLRLLLKLPLDQATIELDHWLAWAQRCQIGEFVRLGRTIKQHKQAILDTIRLGMTNARIEAINNKIKLTIRMGYGFRNIDNLIALLMLRCGALQPALPGRQTTHTSS